MFTNSHIECLLIFRVKPKAYDHLGDPKTNLSLGSKSSENKDTIFRFALHWNQFRKIINSSPTFDKCALIHLVKVFF